MKISDLGINLIKKFEGCKLNAYTCPSGVWTIGYGHTKGVKKSDTITLETAEKLLREDLTSFEKQVYNLIIYKVRQCEFDALVSFTYNIGAGAFKDSTMLKYLNQKRKDLVPEQFARWNKSNGKVLAGLVKRRKFETDLFNGELHINDL
ncbi:MAG: lysozyme [Fusobacteriaceae bacterium]